MCHDVGCYSLMDPRDATPPGVALKILAAIDLNTTGHDWLVGRAAGIAAAVRGSLDLLFVTTRAGEVDARQQELATLLDTTGVQGAARVLVGHPIEVLLQETASYDALVVGPREPGALERFFLGTFATRIIRDTRCAVWVARADTLPEHAPRVLVGLDLRRGDPAWVVGEADRWTERLGGTLHCVFAEKDPSGSIPDAKVRAKAHEEWQKARVNDKAQVDELMAAIPEARRGEGALGTGDPAECLAAMSKLYDLVVVGNRRTGISDLLVGSIAQQVVRGAVCDVLTLPSATHD